LATILIALAFASGQILVHATDIEPTYEGPDICKMCHETQYQEWNQTRHAKAYTDPEFQLEWIKQDSPTSCLACHTTGLDKETGEFQFEGVICEVCHGPEFAMEPVTTAEVCSTCHSFSPFPIYQEWLESEHSHADVDCIDCHEFHSLELREEEPVDLCASCHEDLVQESVEGTHGSEGYDCIDCHMVTRPYNGEEGESAILGHTFIPGPPTPDCMSCHEVLLEAHDVWGAESDNCVICHDEVHMTMLHLFNGTDLAMSDSSVLCKQCHNDIYYEWNMGIHADPHIKENECIDCHAPMNPYIMMNATLPPLDQETEPEEVKAILPPTIFFGAIIVAGGAGAYVFLGKRRNSK
jgi:hypothetical protein